LFKCSCLLVKTQGGGMFYMHMTMYLIHRICRVYISTVYIYIYIDSLRAGLSGDRVPVGGEIFRTRLDRPWGTPSL